MCTRHHCVYVHVCASVCVVSPHRPAYGTKHFREEDDARFLGAQVGQLMCFHGHCVHTPPLTLH